MKALIRYKNVQLNTVSTDRTYTPTHGCMAL